MRLDRIKSGYTDGARQLASRAACAPSRESRVTPNQLTALGFSLNIVAAVLLYRGALLVGGRRRSWSARSSTSSTARWRARAVRRRRSARSSTRRPTASPRALVLGAAALVFARDGDTWPVAAVFVALVGIVPGLVHPRTRRGPRPRRQGRPDGPRRARGAARGRHPRPAPWGALPYGIALLAALQRVHRRAAHPLRASPARCRASGVQGATL